MSIINRLFGKKQEKIDCPRCLGKGHVTWEDIKRMNRELKWRPGSCAYCNGTGKVYPDIVEKIPIETTYLSTDISAREARKLQNGDKDALERAAKRELDIDNFICEIMEMHGNKMSISQIADHYFLKFPLHFRTDFQKNEFTDYVQRVVAHINK
jgi:hypothetical protein